MFPGDLQLDALFEDHGVLVLSLKTFLHLSGQSIGGAFQRNILFRSDRRFNRRKWAHLLQDLVAADALPPHSAHFPLQLLEVAHRQSEREDNDIHILDVLSLGCRSLHLYKNGSRAGSGSTARPPAVRFASDNRKSPRQTARPRTYRGLHTGWTSQQIILRSIASWKFATTSSQLPRQQPGSKFSNAVFPFGKNYNSSSRITRASRVRHSQTVCISLQRPTFGTIPLQRTPDPNKSEHLFGSSPSPSESVWN